MERIKVVWICEVSNPEIRSHLHLHNTKYYWKNILKRILNKNNLFQYFDRGVWNTLAIKEFEKHPEVELHVITPMNGVKRKLEEFEMNGIFYHVLNLEGKAFLTSDKKYSLQNKKLYSFRKSVTGIIDRIQPDIINMIGAENPEYAICAEDIDIKRYPFLLTMQTALSDPSFPELYPMDKKLYEFRSGLEQTVFKKANYIGTDAKWYHEISSRYNNEAEHLRFHLCSEQNFEGVETNVGKEFDFVYYAMDISKGGEDAIKAFCIASQDEPSLKLNVIGKYSSEFYNHLLGILEEYGLNDNVTFSGFFDTHTEALQQMVKSRCALIPTKVDIISGTVREPMALGIPVVTYITKGTPSLNKDAKCVLLSEIGDYQALANNMIMLIKDAKLRDELAHNSKVFVENHFDSTKGVQLDIEVYKAVISHFNEGRPIPSYLKEAIY